MACKSQTKYWMGAETSVKGGGLFKFIFEYVRQDSSQDCSRGAVKRWGDR